MFEKKSDISILCFIRKTGSSLKDKLEKGKRGDNGQHHSEQQMFKNRDNNNCWYKSSITFLNLKFDMVIHILSLIIKLHFYNVTL